MTWRTKEAEQVEDIVHSAVKKGKILGGICDASAFLAKAGVLNTVKHTSNDLNDIKQWGAGNYTGEANYCYNQAVRDNNIVTANGTASIEFAREVMLALGMASEGKINEWYNFHKLGYYNAAMPKDAKMPTA